jgi:hypothetical protein
MAQPPEVTLPEGWLQKDIERAQSRLREWGVNMPKPDPQTTKLSAAQQKWLAVLAQMASPLCCPGAGVTSYKALANRKLATKEQWPGEPSPGWVITEAGRNWLRVQKMPDTFKTTTDKPIWTTSKKVRNAAWAWFVAHEKEIRNER